MSLLSTKLFPRLDQVLEPLEFRKKGPCWYRPRSDGLQLICSEASQLRSKGVSRFTLSCGLFRGDVFEMTWNRRAPEFPKQIDCYIRRRIGDLARDRRDRWWALTAEDDSPVHDACKILTDLMVPFLDEVSEPSSALAALRRDSIHGHEKPLSTIYLAVVLALSGSAEDDYRALLRAVAQIAPAWSQRSREVLQRISTQIS
jgi:hypothetical protein